MERTTINNEGEWREWCLQRRKHDYDFEGDACHYIAKNKFPISITWVDTESNGYPTVEYWIDYPCIPYRHDANISLTRLNMVL